VVQSKLFSANKTLQLQGKIFDLSTPKVMGILNITPDSFFDGGRYNEQEVILKQAEKMIVEGADLIDVGGYSSRPGAKDISLEEELNRVVPVFRALKKEFPSTPLSIDTFRSAVAKASIEEGASLVNDISGGELDPAMFPTVAACGVPYILMHMRGNPQTMNQLTEYDNFILDILNYLQQKLYHLKLAGVKDVIIDPGFGFSKTVDQNFILLQNLPQLQILEKPILVGLSRKSMIWRTLTTTPELALNGTSVLNTIALLKGASLLRVHDVKEAQEVIKLLAHL